MTRDNIAVQSGHTIGHGNRSLDEFTSCSCDPPSPASSTCAPSRARGATRTSDAASSSARCQRRVSLTCGKARRSADGGARRPTRLTSRCATTSFRAYADHMESADVQAKVSSVSSIVPRRAPVAIMCAERLPWQCHRYMISDYLVAHGVEVLHLMDTAQAAARTALRERSAGLAAGSDLRRQISSRELGLQLTDGGQLAACAARARAAGAR